MFFIHFICSNYSVKVENSFISLLGTDDGSRHNSNKSRNNSGKFLNLNRDAEDDPDLKRKNDNVFTDNLVNELKDRFKDKEISKDGAVDKKRINVEKDPLKDNEASKDPNKEAYKEANKDANKEVNKEGAKDGAKDKDVVENGAVWFNASKQSVKADVMGGGGAHDKDEEDDDDVSDEMKGFLPMVTITNDSVNHNNHNNTPHLVTDEF